MSIDARERNQPTKEEQLELLEMLAAAVEEGQLLALAFMLQKPMTGETIVDYRGSFEHSELTCRTVNLRIADSIEGSDPSIAAAIRRDLANQNLLRLQWRH